ncbi:MAG: tyrosine-type recombinase/integrase [Arcobacteraceae bacterium]|jgi:integrase|nr:tyrosine-type recombinase/integrase [Arcobacteraceae bacterium]
MPKTTKQLTDTEIKKAKSKEKDYKLSDGQGLYIVIKKNGSKMWRFDFSFDKKRKSMSFGLYPEISLKEAREKRELARENIRKNINPIDSKNSNFKIETTFKFVALKWLELMKKSWSESNYKKIKSNLENNAFPHIGNKEIKNITRKEILNIIEKMENRNAIEYANRLLNNIQRIYKYAVTNEWTEYNIISDIDKTNTLQKREKNHMPALTKENEIVQLIKDINSYGIDFKSDISTIYALKIFPFLPLRPYNLRSLEWSEIDFNSQKIEIPKEKMKMKVDFVLPLSSQAKNILREVEKYKSSIYVFPSSSSNSKFISENTLNHALHRMGYKNKHSSHGFRSMFSTIAHEKRNEHGINSDVIEACLAHAEPNSVKAAYNRVEKMKYIDEKRVLMQWWSDWIQKNYPF